MTLKNLPLRFCCAVLLAFCLVLPIHHFQALAEEDQLSRPPTPQDKFLHVTAFSDRSVLKKGEIINVKVLVEAKFIEVVTVTAFFADNQLRLVVQNPQEIHLPIKAPVTFSFISINTGKSNVLIQVEGSSQDGKYHINEIQQIQSIEVQEGSYSLVSLFPASLLGVVVGVLLTLCTTILNDIRQRRKDVAEKRRWVTASLPAQLQADREAVLKRGKAGSDFWKTKLLTEGYYYHLVELVKRRPDQLNLPQELIELASALGEYEERRVKDMLLEREQQSLATRLNEVAQSLRGLL